MSRSAIRSIRKPGTGTAPQPSADGGTLESSSEDTSPLVVQMPLDVRSLALSTLAVLTLLLALNLAQSFLIPIVIGVLATFALEPAVAWLCRWRVPRGVAAAVVLGSLTVASGWTIYSLADE